MSFSAADMFVVGYIYNNIDVRHIICSNNTHDMSEAALRYRMIVE